MSTALTPFSESATSAGVPPAPTEDSPKNSCPAQPVEENPERALRALWSTQGVSTERQNALIEGIIAKARPGAQVGPFRLAGTRGN